MHAEPPGVTMINEAWLDMACVCVHAGLLLTACVCVQDHRGASI